MKNKIYECVGCGYCCLTAQCSVSINVHGVHDICPSLIWNADKQRHECKLIDLPGVLGEKFRKMLFIGEGCCSSLNSWRREKNRNRIEEKQKEIKLRRVSISSEMQELCASLGKQFISSDVIILTVLNFKNIMMKKHGWDEHFAEIYSNKLLHYISQQRSSISENFLG